MKTITVIVFFFLTIQLTAANDIDNLKTKEDVRKFLVTKVNPKWDKEDFFETHANETDTSAFGKGKFFKLDLDNNGLTDLLINGTYLFAITDKGNGAYEVHSIDRGAFMLDKHTLANIIYINKTPLLIIRGYTEYHKYLADSIHTDTLVFKFGGFIEYNAKADNLGIEEIKFSTSGCYGTCPIFKLSIKANRSAIYNAIDYNDKKGNFKAITDTTSFNEIIRTIKYIKLISLKNDYSVSWTDDATSTLEIEFNNGQTKKITDYGEIGTFGLETLYNQLYGLRKTQKWK